MTGEAAVFHKLGCDGETELSTIRIVLQHSRNVFSVFTTAPLNWEFFFVC